MDDLQRELMDSARWYVAILQNGRYDMIEPAKKELIRAVEAYENELGDDA